uniref:PacC n=1 Tax=Ganoderma lucidum TaxID=5315 RepID=A0A3S8Q1S1_GANLU|nr:PacC [Ganoderma lucidum]
MSHSPHSPKSSPAAPSPSDAAEPPPSDNTASPTSAPTSSSPPSEDPAPGHQCQWISCDKTLPDPESLYNHLCNDHIGRKSTGNLCLTFHTPLKPHVCEICRKPFKRPQDLKKHEKIHTEEHHAQHKHSKAITVADPAYSSRVRGEGDKPRSLGPPPGQHHAPMARAKSSSVPLSDGSSGPDFGVLPTPSPELDYSPEVVAAHDRNQMYRVQQQLPTWEVLAEDVPARSGMVSGTKRSHDYTVDDFFTDVKKRRVNPAYDSHMAARLSNLAYQQSLSSATNGGPPPGSHGPQFPPRSISFDIRTPEELAAVNEFLITLGRDVSGPGAQSRHQHSQSVPHASMNDASFFDPANLAQLGLVGMPGVPSAPGPGSGTSYHGESGFIPNDFAHHGPSYPSRPPQHSVQSVQFGLYPTAQDLAGPATALPYTASRVRAHRASATDEHLLPMGGSPPYPHQSYSGHAYPHYLTPPLEVPNAGASPLSSHSGMSTPPNATPPHISLTMSPESAAAFDFVRTSHGPPVVQLAPVDYGTKNMRTMIPLKSAGPGPSSSSSALATRPEPMEPKLGGALHRGLPARLTSSAASSLASSSSSATALGKSSSLYPLLTSGDEQFKLPPLAGHFCSSPSAASSREPTVSPTLPSSALTLTTRRSPSPLSDGSTPSPKPLPYLIPPLTSALEREKERERESDVAYPVLPPISSLAASYREHQEELARGVGRIQLENKSSTIAPEERGRHAALVRDLLVAINAEYRTRFGTPPPPPPSSVRVRVKEEPRGLEREVRDVEMIAV